MASITLQGEPYRIFYSLDAAAELDERWGLNILKLSDMPESEWDRPLIITRLLWAGLLCDHPDLTVKEAGRLVDLAQLPEVIKQIAGAIEEQFGQEENPTEGGQVVTAKTFTGSALPSVTS